MPTTRYVAAPDGLDLAYRIFEGGPADLVFVHAFVSAMEIFWEWPPVRTLYSGLSSFARVVEHDGRGSGLSGRPSTPPTLETRMQDVGVVMDAAGLERAAIFSYADGAAVSALFAATYPERVSALALFHPTVRTAWAEDYPWGARHDDEAEFRAATRAAWGNDDLTTEQIESFSGDLGSIAEDPAFRRWWTKARRYYMTPAEYEAFDHVWMETDVRDILPSIQAPTIVLHRAEDDDDRGVHAMIEHAIPGATRKQLPGTEWMPGIGDIDAIVDAVAEHLRVERPAPEHDRVLASILFTDIVGSTQLAAEIGDRAWRDLLGRHHEVVREQLERFRGLEVDTAGDGFLARFDGPARGVRCAQAIVDAVRPLGLEIRAGLHTGEVELVGAKIEGIAVHTGARISALAGPSEVLVSSTVKDLVAGSGLVFEDAGEHELKGVPDDWRLYRVIRA